MVMITIRKRKERVYFLFVVVVVGFLIDQNRAGKFKL